MTWPDELIDCGARCRQTMLGEWPGSRRRPGQRWPGSRRRQQTARLGRQAERSHTSLLLHGHLDADPCREGSGG